MMMFLNVIALLVSLPLVSGGAGDVSASTDHFFIALACFWAVCGFVFFVQVIQCIARLRQAAGHRSPYVFLVIGLILATLYCIEEVYLALQSPPPSANAPLLAVDGILYVFSISFLFLAIIFCLWDRENALNAATKGAAGQRHFGHMITHALVFALRVVLAGTDIGLKVPLDGAVMMNVTQGAEESLSFYMSAAFLGIMTIDVFITTFILRRAMHRACVSHKVMDLLLYVVAPLYALNASAHIIDFIQDTTKDRSRDSIQATFSLVRGIVNNFTFFAIAACLLAKRAELVDLHVLNNDSSRGESPISSEKNGLEDAQFPSLGLTPTAVDSDDEKHQFDEKRPYPVFRTATTNFSGIIEEHTRELSVSEKALLDIVAFFQQQENERRMEKEQADRKKPSEAFKNKMITDSQVFSALSVVTVFVASLSISLVALAQSTYSNNQILIAVNPISLRLATLPSATDNTYSCWYMSTFLSLVAGCASGIGAAARNYMAHDHHGAAPAGWMRRDGQIDRALPVVFVFVCLTMTIAVITLIIGLLLFVWEVQTPFVAAATSAPGLAFVLAGALAVGLWVPGRR